MERVLTTMPTELRQEVDAAASEIGKSRSQVVREALEAWLAHRKQEAFERLLEEAYIDSAAHAEKDAMEYLKLAEGALEGRWRWDDD